ncbi:MAG: hypothetical protein WKF75_01725 [Singulisphaera sp.]
MDRAGPAAGVEPAAAVEPPRGHAVDLTWRVASNMRRFPTASSDGTHIDHRYFDLGSGRARHPLRTLRAFLGSASRDAIVVHQAQGPLLLLCLLRLLTPFRRPRLVVVDLLLSRPGPGLRGRLKNRLMRALFRAIDLCILYQKDTAGLWEYYDPAREVPVHPVQGQRLRPGRGDAAPEGNYVYSAGRSYRDFPTLCEAVFDLGYPTVILTPEPREGLSTGPASRVGTSPACAGHPRRRLGRLLAGVHGRRQADGADHQPRRPLPGGRRHTSRRWPWASASSSPNRPRRGILEHEETAIIVPMQDAPPSRGDPPGLGRRRVPAADRRAGPRVRAGPRRQERCSPTSARPSTSSAATPRRRAEPFPCGEHRK